jgi:hypothetical protein
MGASHRIKLAKVRGSDCQAYWTAPSPRIEALALLQMLRRGATVDDIGELIAIPSEMEQSLRAFAAEHPDERQRIERVIESRQCVSEEFEPLVCKGHGFDVLIVS